MLPSEKAKAVYAVYAFCRIADDIVDVENSPEGLEKIQLELNLMHKGSPVDKPVWRALSSVFERFDMSRHPFDDMLTGQRLDLEFKQPETIKALEDYCYYVAGTVGLMLLPILAEEHHKELEQAAIDLGRAMQITNILRDVGEDLSMGRIYLPVSVMQNYNCSEDMLNSPEFRAGRVSDSFKQLWEDLAVTAENYYRSFEKKIELFDADSRLPLLSAGRLYKAILEAVRKAEYDCITKRNKISPVEKKNIIILVRKELEI